MAVSNKKLIYGKPKYQKNLVHTHTKHNNSKKKTKQNLYLALDNINNTAKHFGYFYFAFGGEKKSRI